MLLVAVAQTWQRVAATSSRREKAGLLAGCLAGLAPPERVPGVAFLCGELRQRQIGVGWASLRDLPAPAAVATLTVAEADGVFGDIGAMAGTGSQRLRRDALGALFGRATESEQAFLRQLLTGELRQGALDGVMVEAVARAADVPVADVRRAVLLRGDLRAVAEAALRGGTAALAEFRLEVGRPLAPMLAQPAEDLGTALASLGVAAVEEKLDGARVQVHRSDGQVRVFTRSLDDITERVPEVVAAAAALPVSAAVLDGEAIALDPAGRPRPFQVTASRIGTRSAARAGVPLSLVLFDALHLDGEDLLDRPGAERAAALTGVAPPDLVVRRQVTGDLGEAAEFYARTLRRGHEGVVLKSLTGSYDAGRRGGSWLKVKPRHTLDLVVLAAEWGHGRRRGWLSNLHLGAADPHGVVGEPGGFVMLGKTFKGLTDAMLTWQTEYLQGLAVTGDDWVVHVRPELVVEVAFDGVQTSPRYPGGVALRFARVKGYRTDRRADEADTIDAVRAIHGAG